MYYTLLGYNANAAAIHHPFALHPRTVCALLAMISCAPALCMYVCVCVCKWQLLCATKTAADTIFCIILVHHLPLTSFPVHKHSHERWFWHCTYTVWPQQLHRWFSLLWLCLLMYTVYTVHHTLPHIFSSSIYGSRRTIMHLCNTDTVRVYLCRPQHYTLFACI